MENEKKDVELIILESIKYTNEDNNPKRYQLFEATICESLADIDIDKVRADFKTETGLDGTVDNNRGYINRIYAGRYLDD